jgi:hypothetical protein
VLDFHRFHETCDYFFASNNNLSAVTTTPEYIASVVDTGDERVATI